MTMHQHEAVVHQQEHAHLVHYEQHGTTWEHLTATHGHAHNHPLVEHDHEAHQDPEKEHLREGHIHDHAHPTTD
jgi:hypothetical protein